MRNLVTIIILGIVSLFIIGCSANDKKYEEHMKSALEQIEAGDLESAEEFLTQALEAKPEDEQAIIYVNQVSDLLLATEKFASGKLSDAKQQMEKVIDAKNGLDLLIEKAQDLKENVLNLENDYETYENDFKKAEKFLADKNFKEAKKLLEEITEHDLNHPFYKKFKKDVTDLKVEISKAEKEEKARIKAEKERLAKEKEKQAEQGIGLFKGYWLRDTMACHFADTYVACALAYSDFITYNEIIDINLISDMEIEITFEDNIKNTFRLLDSDSLELEDGVYQRVTAKEANAIYDGYYTLP